MSTHLLGRRGEQVAAAYLQAQGYHICTHNYRSATGEIDIIAEYKDILVFIEVKGRHSTQHGLPEEAVSSKKEKSITDTAQQYIEEHGWHKDIRFDIFCIEWGAKSYYYPPYRCL